MCSVVGASGGGREMEVDVINQVLVAGLLAEDPRVVEGAGGPCVELELLLERPPREWGPAQTERTRVRVSAFGDGRIATLTRYLRKGRALLVHGFLRARGADGLQVVLERFEFMEDGLVARSPDEVRRVAAA
ncbi:MAG: single-stranded DNA-binding protein [Planctomycetes bacterium]|nr:single-stranded DNA-binding protein [Planctomycetota bacterium]